jgi:hypothetical protein
LSDVNESLLFGKISSKFEIPYLSVCKDVDRIHWGIGHTMSGIIYGEHARPMIALPCSVGAKDAHWVLFIIDTGARSTELSPAAMAAVCQTDAIPACCNMFIAGVKVEVVMCAQGPQSNHSDVPVLGKNFYLKAGVVLSVDYKDLSCTLTRQV